MATTEDTRRQRFETVRANLGEPAAEALMAVTIPANTDLATRAGLDLLRRDLDLLRAELHADMAGFRVELRDELRVGQDESRGRMAALEARIGQLEARVGRLETKLDADVKVLRAEMTAGLAELRTYLMTRFLPAVGAVVTVIVGVAALLA
jgi:multidrug efflux pump subunit AcrA (membrane-fusion protein)